MQYQNNSQLYVIIAPKLFGLPDEGPWYLAWQPPVWDDDGYFWTSEETFFEVLKRHPEYNTHPHKFTFKTEEAARAFAESSSDIRRVNYVIKEIT